MQNRRNFIRYLMGAGGALAFTNLSAQELFARKELVKLVILHTNDVHSRLEPFPANDPKFGGMGGAARRSALIRSIRNAEPNVLLFDAGDIFQGTPYFNFYLGEPEIKAMSAMGYDAATIGNHDFDGGIENLAKQVTNNATFPLLNVNYGIKNTPLEGIVLPYKTFDKGGVRVGVFGVGIELAGLVPPNLYGGVQYNGPIEVANNTAKKLKHDLDCDIVVCLSHLGYSYSDTRVSDLVMATQTEHIDLIIGGHTHTFLETPSILKNKVGKPVMVNQVGWAGLNLGRINFYVQPSTKKHHSDAYVLKILKSQ